jgi:hypothetical protein
LKRGEELLLGLVDRCSISPMALARRRSFLRMSALETWLVWPQGLIAVPEGHAKAVKTAFKTPENPIQS